MYSGSKYAGTYAVAYQLQEDSDAPQFSAMYRRSRRCHIRYAVRRQSAPRDDMERGRRCRRPDQPAVLGRRTVRRRFRDHRRRRSHRRLCFHWPALGDFSATYAGNDPAVASSLFLALYDYSGHVAGNSPLAGPSSSNCKRRSPTRSKSWSVDVATIDRTPSTR